jgi:hypothetical protein
MATSKTENYEVDIKDLCQALDEMIAWATDIRLVLSSAKRGSKIIVPMGPPRGQNPRYYGNCPPPRSESKVKVALDGPVPTNPVLPPPKYFNNCPASAPKPSKKVATKKPNPRGKKSA